MIQRKMLSGSMRGWLRLVCEFSSPLGKYRERVDLFTYEGLGGYGKGGQLFSGASGVNFSMAMDFRMMFNVEWM